MKRLTTVEEVREFHSHKVVKVYSNFQQLVNGRDEAEVLKSFPSKPFYITAYEPDYYIGDSASAKIYDLGNGYYMTTDEQKFHKAVNRMAIKEGYEHELLAFAETISIYKVI